MNLKKELLTIRDLGQSFQSEVIRLRKLAYLAAHGAAIDTKALDWSHTDTRSQHLGIFKKAQLVSVLRLTYVNDPIVYERVLLQKPSGKTPLPGLILSRAATDPNEKLTSLNQLLRYTAFQEARRRKIDFVYGTVIKRSRRLSFLESLGYEWDLYESGWTNSFWQTSEPSVLLRLDLNQNFNRATERLLSSFEPEILTSTLTLELCPFEEILPSWRDHLWPERQSPIEPISWLNHRAEVDSSVPSHAEPIFFVMKDLHGKTCAVVSGHKTDPFMFRSRGLWVHPDWREKGVGTVIMRALENEARSLGSKVIWTMPRQSAAHFYEKNGFSLEKQIEGFEFGPHWLALKSLEQEVSREAAPLNSDNKS